MNVYQSKGDIHEYLHMSNNSQESRINRPKRDIKEYLPVTTMK